MQDLKQGPEALSHEVLNRHESLIRTALRIYAERMDESAREAQTAYEWGVSNPEVKAVQDNSYVTNVGYKYLAVMGRESAESARRAADEILTAILGQDDSEGENE